MSNYFERCHFLRHCRNAIVGCSVVNLINLLAEKLEAQLLLETLIATLFAAFWLTLPTLPLFIPTSLVKMA
ncbi:hypothetical protein PCC8801_2568 [Rippkaea orientalis PCC 8801]|uniref:Uncharacterized protein n=1 Tax=Rippkaea orientalis (strain PCC 8801 / RF-1) TaxID=41431 RepID=B7K4R8_RIPO1|nr:hypothetical protein PCC8801_2568 [Rippkaea orientalis PCC 8801]